MDVENTPINIFNSDENVEIDQCCICLCEMNEKDETIKNEIYKLDCGHKFHTDCIIDAFRRTKNSENGMCPLCRQKPVQCSIHVRRKTDSKFKVIFEYIEKHSKIKGEISKPILKMIKDYKKIKVNIKKYKDTKNELARELKKFDNENKELLNKVRNLRSDKTSLRYTIRRSMGIAKKILKEKLKEVENEKKNLENDNKTILKERTLLVSKRIRCIRKFYQLERQFYLKKNEIEDLPIIPIYVKKKT